MYKDSFIDVEYQSLFTPPLFFVFLVKLNISYQGACLTHPISTNAIKSIFFATKWGLLLEIHKKILPQM